MSLFGLFDIGKSALFASQSALSITSNNIANVNTPGYTKKSVILEIATPTAVSGGFLGQGVRIAGIRRSYDEFIQNQLLGQYQNYGRSLSLNRTLSSVEQVFNESIDFGLSKSLAEYFNAWHEVSTNPEGQPQRATLLQKAGQLVQTAKNMESSITKTLVNVNVSIGNLVERINTISSEIASLNEGIVNIEAGQEMEKAFDLRDKRDNLLRELSELVNISYFEDKNGSITVLAGMRSLVSGINSYKLSVKSDIDGTVNIVLNDTNMTSFINKGQLGGLLSIKKDIENVILMPLRKLIASIVKETNLLHKEGYGLDGSTGNDFFSPLQLYTFEKAIGADVLSANIADLSAITLDEYEVTFDGSGNYTVINKQTGAQISTGLYQSGVPIQFDGIELTITGTVSEGDTFFVSPLKDAIKNFDVGITDVSKIAAALSASTLPADNENALRIAGLSTKDISDLNDQFSVFYSNIVSRVGTLSKASEDSLKFDENLINELNNRREAVSGVSLDEEATDLIRFQRSYEAAARLIKVTDELLQTILEL
jgi:flagellar hook-associated protein 1 FlgK